MRVVPAFAAQSSLALVFAVQSSHLPVFTAVLGFGLVVAVAGHIIRSRTLIITGLLVIGLASAYFSFILQPAGR